MTTRHKGLQETMLTIGKSLVFCFRSTPIISSVVDRIFDNGIGC